MSHQDETYHPTRREWDDLNARVDAGNELTKEIHTALIGNELGTTGVIKRLARAESWIASARVKLAVIAAAIGGGASAAGEAIKAAFGVSNTPPGH
jgi:hypothetical protein